MEDQANTSNMKNTPLCAEMTFHSWMRTKPTVVPYAWRSMRTALCVTVFVIASQTGCDSKPAGDPGPTAGASTTTSSMTAKAEAGDSSSMVALGRAYALGTDGFAKDELLAFKWYLRAAEAGLPKAMAEVARRYRDGIGVREDFAASLRWADKGAEMGDADAIYLSAIRNPFDLYFGWQVILDVDSQEKKLIADSVAELGLLTRAAEGGNVEAKLRLGRLLRMGVWYTIKGKLKSATAPNSDKALEWLNGAADAGSSLALLELAQWYQKGGDGLKANTSLADKYWDRIDAVTSADGQYAIGREVQPADRKYYKERAWRDQILTYEQASWKAREWLERASGQGHVRAALDLGNMLSSTQYGYNDEPKAFALLMRAAEAGLIDGQTAVAWAYYKGSGVAKNYERAYAWSLRAATHPTATHDSMRGSQRFVAQMLAQGLGVEKDVVLAYAWANVSAASGDKEAKELLTRLDLFLDAGQVREAQQVSSAWKLGDDLKRLGTGGAHSPGASASAAASGLALKLAGSGTGFFISGNGTLVTNYHVAGKCAEVRLPALAKKAAVLASDAANDLTALRVDGVSGDSARLADPSQVKQGQEIVAFGFPLEGYLPSAGNITTGLISALSGPANNSSLIQISSPVQQGNSGGPVMDLRGEVVGVVVGKADVIRIAKATGDILQNVNFAVSAASLQAFLDANRLEYKKSSYFSMTKKPDALVDSARAFTAKVECWR